MQTVKPELEVRIEENWYPLIDLDVSSNKVIYATEEGNNEADLLDNKIYSLLSVRRKNTDSNGVEFAKNELELLLKKSDEYDKEQGVDSDNIQQLINDNILELVELFASQGHSGLTANYVIHYLSRLLNFKPISPITGESDEWSEAYESRQNKRCSSIFYDNDDPDFFYDINAFTFHEVGTEKGDNFNGGGLIRRYYKEVIGHGIEFPYNPPEHPTVVEVKLNKDTDEYEFV